MSECYFNRGTKCAALRDKKCTGCSFRKTHKQMIEGRRKADERIASLPYEQREYIAEKYGRFIAEDGETV